MSTDVKAFAVEAESAGTRLDSFLAHKLGEFSRTKLQRAIEDEDILVNESAAKPSYRLRVGDRIEIDLPEPPPSSLVPEPIPLNIVYEDDDLIVVDKPAGMIVHPGAGVESGTLANALAYHFAQLSSAPGVIRPGIVHRIDKETSGLLIVAKTDYAHERLSDQFQARTVFKLYIALVYGRLSQSSGEIEANIGRSSHNRTRMAVLRGGKGRHALTLFEVAESYPDFTLVKVQIKTGRTHQIRVHMTHIGHPVVGDSTYGGGRENTIRNAALRKLIQSLGRQFLHSAQIAFAHPRSGERMEFESSLPAELVSFLSKLI